MCTLLYQKTPRYEGVTSSFPPHLPERPYLLQINDGASMGSITWHIIIMLVLTAHAF